ncbi:signal peptidase I [Streptomyces sp. NBC_01381]|uniref:signal peptidase I n=1 Tax=Streptomyces sp. NBC_01381 TaxID=2903845 RepID=UPI002253CD02|nr:signal peptidase I [Streptomyces sp. NBC_01381]MCX4670313.1 signal peptidase I [Streptomyces sp. NBC_01381]
MGDVAVGARSGHGGPEEQPGRSDEPEVEAAADGVSPGSDTAGDEPAPAEPDGKPAKGAKKPRSFWKELPLLIGIALILALVIKTFLVQAFSIPSDSMQNTLQQGDRVLVDKLTPWFGSEPERGEVVVFRDPGHWLDGEPTPDPNAIQRVLGWVGLMPSADEKDLIKRVIAVGGDTVECKGTGPVKVNGKALNEPYVFEGNTPCSVDDQGGQFKVTVPAGKIWVMGDHRQNSLDSRYHQNQPGGGAVPVDNVVGRAIVIAWPPTRWATLPKPDTFDQPGISAALSAAPGALGLAGAVPVVLWRRRRLTAAAAGSTRVSGGGTAG